jgi:hypothetical protein
MKLLAALKYLFLVAGIVFLFINWKIASALFVIGSILHVIPHGPNALLSVVTGYLIIGGIASFFFNWRIGICLIVVSLLVAKFRVWGNRKNSEYYKGNEHPAVNSDQEESDTK